MAMVAAEAAGAGATESAGGAAARGVGGSQIGKALGAAGAPTVPPGSVSGQGSGRPAGEGYRGKTRRQQMDQLGRDKRRAKSVTPKIGRLNFRDPRKIVLAEFLICCVIAGLRPFAKSDPKKATEGSFVQFSAIAAMFFTLSLMTSGKKSGNVAAAFGALVTLGVLFRNQVVFSELATFFKTQSQDEMTG